MPTTQNPVWSRIADPALNAIDKIRRRSPRGAQRICTFKLLGERGGLPWVPGERPRKAHDRVRELAAQMEQLGEMLEWDHGLANAVRDGHQPLHFAIMVMRQERGYYDGPFGELRYQVDVLVQQRIDPTVDVGR